MLNQYMIRNDRKRMTMNQLINLIEYEYLHNNFIIYIYYYTFINLLH